MPWGISLCYGDEEFIWLLQTKWGRETPGNLHLGPVLCLVPDTRLFSATSEGGLEVDMTFPGFQAVAPNSSSIAISISVPFSKIISVSPRSSSCPYSSRRSSNSRSPGLRGLPGSCGKLSLSLMMCKMFINNRKS